MLLCEIVTPRSNGNLITKRKLIKLPYDVEMTSVNGDKLLHKAGVEVKYQMLKTTGTDVKIKLSRTLFSTVLSFDSAKDLKDSGFILD